MGRKKTIAVLLGDVVVILVGIALMKKPYSIYKNEPEEQNPLEGKQVIFFEDLTEEVNADGVRGHLEIIGVSKHQESFYEKYSKRVLDIILSLCGMIVLWPAFLVISIAIFIDDPGPIIFTQKRVGKNKQYFRMHKFRSMKVNTQPNRPTHMLENPEQYITRVGKFLRAHSMDELPQMWDIFLGNMSVIGPRPALWNQDLLIAEREKWNANSVKPGLTGLAQITGRDKLELSMKAKIDGEYCRNLGLKMDIVCFFKSIGVFKGDNSAIEGGTGALRKDRGGR